MKRILHLAIPSIISNITVPLLGLVDLAIIGHIGDSVAISAISIGSMIFNILYWLLGFLRMGTSGFTSQALGRRDLAEVVQTLLRALTIAFAFAFAFIILQRPLFALAAWLMNTPSVSRPFVASYFSICIWGAPAMLGLYALTGWFTGMQNTRVPMIVAISQNIVNIIASLTLVFGFHMKIEGVAAGTLIAQWAGFIVSATICFAYYRRLLPYLRWRKAFTHTAMSRFFHVNRDIFLRTLFLIAVNLFFTSAGARQGTVMLSVNTLLMTLYLLFSYIMDGFAYAGEALAGKYYGAGNAVAFRQTVRNLFLLGAIMVVLFTAVYALSGPAFLHLLTSDKAVCQAATPYFIWTILIPLVGVSAFIFDGIFIGITATRGMLLSAAIATVSFFLLFFFLFPLWANHALWLSFIVFMAMRGIVQWIIYMRQLRMV